VRVGRHPSLYKRGWVWFGLVFPGHETRCGAMHLQEHAPGKVAIVVAPVTSLVCVLACVADAI